jgi:CheY-like chemotaxis protein
MAEIRVLVADDDSNMLDLMVRRLGRMGLQADRAPDGTTALAMIEATSYDLILTDIYMPGATGLDILAKAKAKDPHAQVVVVTGSASLDNAVDALNEGAFSYLSKPFDHMSVFDTAVSRALEFRRLIRDNQRLAEIQRRRGDMLEAEVTERIRQMRRKQQDLVDLLARLPQGLVVVDTDGRMLMSNALAEKWLAEEAREASQPLRRYLSSVTPPSRATTAEVVLAGLSLRLTAQALPEAGGKGRTLVIIEEEEHEASPTGLLASSVEKLKPGLEWLARQVLDEKETEVVRLLSMQVAAIERMVLTDRVAAGPIQPVEVDWKGVDLSATASGGSKAARPSAPEVRGRPQQVMAAPQAARPTGSAQEEVGISEPPAGEAERVETPEAEAGWLIIDVPAPAAEPVETPLLEKAEQEQAGFAPAQPPIPGEARTAEAQLAEPEAAPPPPPPPEEPKALTGVLRRLKSRRGAKPVTGPVQDTRRGAVAGTPQGATPEAVVQPPPPGADDAPPVVQPPAPKREEELNLSELLEALREEERLGSGGEKLRPAESPPAEPPPAEKEAKGNGSGGERVRVGRQAKVWPPPLPSEVGEE